MDLISMADGINDEVRRQYALDRERGLEKMQQHTYHFHCPSCRADQTFRLIDNELYQCENCEYTFQQNNDIE